MKNINFNADIGEGIGNEAELLPYLQSCNISCGAHAGSIIEIQLAIKLAIQYDVKIGAHPSIKKKKNFGRKSLILDKKEIYESVKKQLHFLNNETIAQGGKLCHVKPHGALYHEASTNRETALAIIQATQVIDKSIAVMGLPNSVFEEVAKEMNSPYIKEGFADRSYHNNGSLVSRKNPKGVLKDTTSVVEQVGSIIKNNLISIEGQVMKLNVDSICFHGDTENAIALLKACHSAYGL